MDYLSILETLSQCGIGALVLSQDGRILSVNQMGDHLLHGNHRLVGQQLAHIAPTLCEEHDAPYYINIGFGEYLIRNPTPQARNLPEGAQLIAFRNANIDVEHDMYRSILNSISEAVILCDAESRISFLNDTAVRLDSIDTQDVRGETVMDVYTMLNDEEMSIPKVIREKRAKCNHRQEYKTCYGKQVCNVAATFPIMQNGQILGAFNVFKDWDETDKLHRKILDLQEKLLQQEQISGHGKKSSLSAQYTFNDIICNSANMHKIIEQCQQVAQFDSSVMFYGETGTGKELFAQSIHNASHRANKSFLAINCAALPENLLESIMFGTEKGAYTNAENRAGLFEQANHGTLLLDELNSMDIKLQAKLLRVLQEGTVRRVGGSKEFHVDVRVLSTLNVPPHLAIAEGTLRKDLFYRLGAVYIEIPPLRNRVEDILLLAKYFIMDYNHKLSRNVAGIDTETLAIFKTYQWPGNVRELQHAIEHAMNILPDNQSILLPQHFPKHIAAAFHQTAQLEPDERHRSDNSPTTEDYQFDPTAQWLQTMQTAVPSKVDESLNNRIQNMERETICQVLRQTNGNVTQAARILKMPRQNLHYRLKRYQIDVQTLRKVST